MPLRVRTYLVDIDKRRYEKVLYKQFDNNVDFKIRVIDKGVDVDLTPYTVRAYFETPNGVVIQKNTQKANSIVTTQIDNNILAQQGFVKAEFNFVEGQGDTQKTVISFTIIIEVEPSIDVGTAIESVPQWDILQDFQNKLDEAVAKADEDVQEFIQDGNTRIQDSITENTNKTNEMITQAQEDVRQAIDKLPKWKNGNDMPTGNTPTANEGDYYLRNSTGDIYKYTTLL
ncbi:MAG: BppU family phage baseplate upper protein [Clostridium sp.]